MAMPSRFPSLPANLRLLHFEGGLILFPLDRPHEMRHPGPFDNLSVTGEACGVCCKSAHNGRRAPIPCEIVAMAASAIESTADPVWSTPGGQPENGRGERANPRPSFWDSCAWAERHREQLVYRPTFRGPLNVFWPAERRAEARRQPRRADPTCAFFARSCDDRTGMD